MSESGNHAVATTADSAAVTGAGAAALAADSAAVTGAGATALAADAEVAITAVPVAANAALSADEIVTRMLSIFLGSNFLDRVWALGNHDDIRVIWGVMGVICGTLAPIYLGTSINGLTGVHAGTVLSMLAGSVTGVIYWVSYKNRDIIFFRAVNRPWYFGPIGNSTILIVSSFIAVVHRNSESATIAFLLLAVVALAFIEIVRPITDYGFLQTFLKMPFVIRFGYYNGFPLSGSEFYACVLVAIYGTLIMPWFHSDRPSRVRARETLESVRETRVENMIDLAANDKAGPIQPERSLEDEEYNP